MVDFVKKRLQVFVSSTYTDLIAERQAAVEAILTAGHFPAGMELFAAGDESQLEVIKQWIDESDVYLLILGGRYGSNDPKSGKSYTQLEYEYAVSKDKPLFACVINDAALEEKVKAHGSSVIEKVEPQKLNAFRELVKTKIVKFWDDHKDIKIAVSETLAQIARREDLKGWIRNEADVSQMILELTRLSQENAALRDQLENLKPIKSTDLTYEEVLATLQKKNLLGYFLSHRNKLLDLHGFVVNSPNDHTRVRELRLLGLIATHNNGWKNVITEFGKVFIARYELLNS
jgi:acylphosphatase